MTASHIPIPKPSTTQVPLSRHSLPFFLFPTAFPRSLPATSPTQGSPKHRPQWRRKRSPPRRPRLPLHPSGPLATEAYVSPLFSVPSSPPNPYSSTLKPPKLKRRTLTPQTPGNGSGPRAPRRPLPPPPGPHLARPPLRLRARVHPPDRRLVHHALPPGLHLHPAPEPPPRGRRRLALGRDLARDDALPAPREGLHRHHHADAARGARGLLQGGEPRGGGAGLRGRDG